MTFPFDLDHRTPPEKVVGQHFRTWTFALGMFPLGSRTIRIDVFEYGRFSECSTSWFQGHACHERTVVEGNDGMTVLTDTLTIEPRARLVDAFMTRAISQTFRRRHRRLRNYLNKASQSTK